MPCRPAHRVPHEEAAVKHPTVGEYMTKDVVSLRPDAGFKEVARVLAERGVSGAPVVDAAGHVIGVVSEADLLHKEEFTVGDGESRHHFESRRIRAARAKATADTARELMSSPAVTVTSETSVPQAAHIMADRGLKRLPVVDGDGVLTGVFSRADVMGVYLTPDRQIRDRVITEVVMTGLWADPAEVRVEVTDGIVTLTGEVELRTQITVVVNLTKRIDGVVDVVDRLTCAFEDTEPVRHRR